jgi:hypothetical protein
MNTNRPQNSLSNAFVSPEGTKLGKVVGGRSPGDFAGELESILGKQTARRQ